MSYNYKFENLDKIFSLQSVDYSEIIIKLHTDSRSALAEYSFINKNWVSLIVTRGDQHTLSMVYSDGVKNAIHFGIRCMSMMTDTEEMLIDAVKQFIAENDILLDYCGGTIKEIAIYRGGMYESHWQLGLYGNPNNVYYLSKTAQSLEEMQKEVEKFITAEEWIKGKAITGITHWTPKNYKLHLK